MILKQFIYSIVHSLLGPNKSNKLIIEDEETYISRCPWQLFQKTVLQEPMSSLFEETLFAHHNLHGCCTLSLIAMWHFWSAEFMCALDDGCEIKDIVINAQNILEKAVFSLSEISMSLDNLIATKNPVDKIGFNNMLNVPSHIPVSIRYSSRHFSPFSQNTCNLEDESENFDKNSTELDEKCLHIIHGLDHDNDAEVSNLVSECWKRQRSFNKSTRFQTEGLLVCPITLPSSYSSVIDGLILKSNLNQPSRQLVKNADTNRALIINGSITFEYTHLGFSPKVSLAVKKISNRLLTSEKDIWRKKCCKLISQLRIDVLLVKEYMDPEIINFCLNHSIMVLIHQPWSSLKIMCYSLQHSPCTYILDCDEECILPNIAIHEWKPKTTCLESQYFVVNAKLKQLLQSIILCYPTSGILEMKAHQLGHFTSRLNSAIKSGQLLPGGGKAEKYCHQELQKELLQETESHKVRLIAAVADGFLNYSMLISKKQELSTHSDAHDDFTSKVSAWHSAMLLACLTLQCDKRIINGIEEAGAIMKL